MKYVFIEKHQAEFSVKAMCRVLRVARSGWYAWRLRRHRPGPRQQFRLVCDEAVRRHSQRQNSVMARLVLLTNCRNTTSKPLPPACAVRDCGLKPAASCQRRVKSVSSATWVEPFTPEGSLLVVAVTRSWPGHTSAVLAFSGDLHALPLHRYSICL